MIPEKDEIMQCKLWLFLLLFIYTCRANEYALRIRFVDSSG